VNGIAASRNKEKGRCPMRKKTEKPHEKKRSTNKIPLLLDCKRGKGEHLERYSPITSEQSIGQLKIGNHDPYEEKKERGKTKEENGKGNGGKSPSGGQKIGKVVWMPSKIQSLE